VLYDSRDMHPSAVFSIHTSIGSALSDTSWSSGSERFFVVLELLQVSVNTISVSV